MEFRRVALRHPSSFVAEEGKLAFSVFPSAPEFSIPAIDILRSTLGADGVPMNLDNQLCGGPLMKHEYSSPSTPSYREEELHAPSSRLQDEKISDDSGTEAKTNSALAPAGLKNPFWK